MVKELKRKFIKTTMLVVTLLLVVFLAAVNIINYVLARREDRSALLQIAKQNLRVMPGMIPGDVPGSDRGSYEGGTGNASGSDMRGSPGQSLGKYFVVRLDADGAVTFSDLTHDPDISFDRMISLINEADVEFAPKATGETETESQIPDQKGDVPPAGGMNPEGDKPPADGMNSDGNVPPADGMNSDGNVPPADGIGSAEEKPPTDGMDPSSGDPPGDAQPPENNGGTAPSDTGKTGSAGGYMYFAEQQAGGYVSFAFLDISKNTAAMIRIVLISAALGAVLWILILFLVIFLSKRAIVPIAENIEKQRQFITNAGHEIKTPLAVIVSNVDVQELHGGKTKWLDNIRSQALRLSDLTKQMLTLAKMEESGTAAFTSTTFDASQLLEDTVRVFRESASLRGIEVQTEIEPGVLIHFPKEPYQQMTELLMDNAVKYGKENGYISVSLKPERKLIRLSFKNNCDALPDIDPDRLFDRFYRSDSSRSRQSGGSGIGLSVVRAIAEQGGGRARAHFLNDQVIEFEIELQKGKF